MSEAKRKSGCFCGAVEIELEGEPAVQAYCHCSSCRGWLGAPIHAATLWPTPQGQRAQGRRAARPVQEDRALIGLPLTAYVAATNRDQTLPWAIAALLLATLITGFAWPHWLVRRLSETRSGTERAEEGETIQFHVKVRNHGWLPRFMVEAVDHLPFVGAARGAASMGDQTLGVVAYIGGHATRSFDVPLLCEKRGFYQLGPVGLATSFPLGLIEARQQKNGGVQSLTIYPDVFSIVSLPLCGTPSEIHRGGFLLPGSGCSRRSRSR